MVCGERRCRCLGHGVGLGLLRGLLHGRLLGRVADQWFDAGWGLGLGRGEGIKKCVDIVVVELLVSIFVIGVCAEVAYGSA